MSRSALTLPKLLIGPAVFSLCWALLPAAITFEARVTASTFAWAVAWWIAQPIPWGGTALLPLVVLPVCGVMETRAVAGLYGQNIFFWILGTVMLGYAMDKHGLAKRFALRLLSTNFIGASTGRLAFGYMAVTAVVSMFVSDAASVAMMIPIGMSVVSYLRQGDGTGEAARGLAGFFALGALLASQAGGLATIAGLPHNALAVATLETHTGRSLGWFEWMKVGLPMSLLVLVCFYSLLRAFLRPGSVPISGGVGYLEAQVKGLGRMSRAEKSVLGAFLGMLALFTFPAFLKLALGASHPTVRAVDTSLPIWVVPPLILITLFLLPSNRRGEATLTWRDVAEKAPWNILLLCTGAVAMTDALAEFGMMDFIKAQLGLLGLGPVTLPYAAALIVGVATNFVSGLAATSLFCNVFIPMAQTSGFNPASMAMLVPNNGLGIVFPWAGAAAGTAFATGYVDLRQMIRIGAAATVVAALLTASVHLLFAPIL